MAVKPVSFISDVLTKRQIIKTDTSGNVLFAVSGTVAGGSVSSSLPLTASGLYIDGNAYITDTIHAKRMHVTEVTTSVYYEDALSASINALQDVSASSAISGNVLTWDGTNWVAGASVGSAIRSLASNVDSRFLVISKLSETHIGLFETDGTKNIELTNYNYADLDYVYIDVMIKESGSNVYKNDLISVQLSGNIDTDKLYVLLDAPALTDVDSYRVITNKQTGSI